LCSTVVPAVTRALLQVVKRTTLTSDDATICAALSPLLYLSDGLITASPVCPSPPLTGEHVLLALSLLSSTTRPSSPPERKDGAPLPAHATALVLRLLSAMCHPGIAALTQVEAIVLLRKGTDVIGSLSAAADGVMIAESVLKAALDVVLTIPLPEGLSGTSLASLTVALSGAIRWAAPLLRVDHGAEDHTSLQLAIAAVRLTARACCALVRMGRHAAEPAESAAESACAAIVSTPAIAAQFDEPTADALSTCCTARPGAQAGVAALALSRGDCDAPSLPAAALVAQDALRRHSHECGICGGAAGAEVEDVDAHDDFEGTVGNLWCQLLPGLLLAFLARVTAHPADAQDPAWEGAVLGCAAEVAATLPIPCCFHLLSWSPLTLATTMPWLPQPAHQPPQPLHAVIAGVGSLMESPHDPTHPPPRASAAVAHVAAIMRALATASDDFAAAYERAAPAP